MGGTYTLGADGMYYPDLELSEEEPHYGKYGRMRLYYLKENMLFKCATFNSSITSVDTQFYNNQYIIVGLESGDAYIMKGYTYNTSDEYTIDKYVINKGQTIQVTEVDGKFVLYHEKDLGRIVQVRYKPNTGNGWDDDFDWL